MKIGFFELEKWEEDYIKEKLKGNEISFFKGELDIENYRKAKDLDVIACFIYSKLNSELLSKLPNVKFVTTMSTGFNHIDIDYSKKKGIKVSNIPYYGGNTVAEHTFGLILTLSKNLDDAISQTKKDNFSLRGLMGFDLKGKTLGVVGTGHIGLNVIKIAKGFGMEVIAYSIKKDLKLSNKEGFRWVSFENLLENSDIITFHVPLTNETRHMINMKNVKKIKRGAFVINTARGEIIDTDALVFGIEKIIIGGAGLDVLEGEEEMKEHKDSLHNDHSKNLKTFHQNHRLLKEKNVVITPHSAFYTREALERILDTTIENIKSFSKGKMVNSVH